MVARFRQTHAQRACHVAAFDANWLDWAAAKLETYPRQAPVIIDEAGRGGCERACEIAWVKPSPDSIQIFQALTDMAQTMNESQFAFDLDRIGEDLQYTIYNEGGRFDWHTDASKECPECPQVRKLSLSLQLSDPDDYEGGDLELAWLAEPYRAPRERGTLIAFPSYMPHRVTPITRGTRKALVCWITGRQFR